MPGRLQRVSTLLTMVGLPQRPLTCGKGGLARGVARDRVEAVDSRGESERCLRANEDVVDVDENDPLLRRPLQDTLELML